MRFDVDLSAAKAIERIGRGHKLPYLAVLAINSTARDVQAAVRSEISAKFTVRSKFVLNQVKLLRASFDQQTGVGKWEARVGIGIGKPPQGSPVLLPKFEAGGTRGGVKGGAVAIPVTGTARPSKAQSIPQALWFQKLALREERKRGRPRKNAPPPAVTPIRKGLLGTFQLPGLGVFQRIGSGPARLLYAFKQSVRLPARLDFYNTARRVIHTQFAKHVQRLVNEAFARHG